MAGSAQEVVEDVLPGFDQDLVGYIVAVLEEMTVEERQSCEVVAEAVVPFIVDSEYASESRADQLCKQIVVAFGGSGYKSLKDKAVEDRGSTPDLLTAPVKIKEMGSHLLEEKKTYGGVVFGDDSGVFPFENHVSNVNSELDATSVPQNTRQKKRAKKEDEKLQRKLRAEAVRDAEERRAMAAARMAAIRASRVSGRKAKAGFNLDGFCIPHPCGNGNLLSDASLHLSSYRRYGLIGKNGSGKTTLMKALANYTLPGLIHMKILLVDQHVEGDDDTPLEWLLRADVERTALLDDEKKINMLLESRDNTKHDANSFNNTLKDIDAEFVGVNLEVALEECYERMEIIGVAKAEQRAREILHGLGFDDKMLEHPTSSLSGGWAMRAALAAALFVRPDLLLLDEPTNHLDVHALVWLEQWLLHHFDGIAIIVSHDHYFLDSVCTDILELKHNTSLSTLLHYSGDYATYVATVEDQKACLARQKKSQDLKMERLQEMISRDGKKCDHHQFQMQRKCRIKKLHALKGEEIEEFEENKDVNFSLPVPHGVFSENETIARATSISYQLSARGGELGSVLFTDVNFIVKPRHRIGIIGKNGCGKTTFLNILLGNIPPTSGNVFWHHGARFAMLQQHHYRGEQLDPDLNALEHVRSLPQDEGTAVGLQNPGSRQEETAYRSYLANYGVLGTTALIKMKYLSGGQRMKVALAVAMYNRPDLLVLDEPTNHLDAESVKALSEALDKFEGAVIVVSHDEAFVNKLLTGTINGVGDRNTVEYETRGRQGELWIMENNLFKKFEGSFREYKKAVIKLAKNTLSF